MLQSSSQSMTSEMVWASLGQSIAALSFRHEITQAVNASEIGARY